ncbi:response regulator transcription factor [Sulfurimonas sp.]|nr:response regulator transcription factor [Sulfurimonas sp.]
MDFKTLKQLTSNLSILYVEDESHLRETSESLFNNLFLTVVTSIDGVDALQKYNDFYKKHNKYYDIVISDIKMPHMDGIELSKKILSINKEQKIIIVSAYDDKEYLIELLNIGINGFLQKPLSPNNIIETIYRTCSSLQNSNIYNLYDGYSFDLSIPALLFEDKKVDLNDNELKLLTLFMKHKKNVFTPIEIFNHLNYEDVEKDFSSDAVKSLIKRLRKKVPAGLIKNTSQVGYGIDF